MSTVSNNSALSTTSGNRAIVWILLGIAVVANIAGYLFNLYSTFVWFDEVIHAYTIFAMTLPLALYAYGKALTGAHRHSFMLILLITSMGLAIGGLWEVAEWIYDWLFTKNNTIKSVPDRLIDLVVDTIGGLVSGWVALSMIKK